MAAALGMAVTALGMVLTPGPNMMYLVSRSISQGRVAGLISLGGTAAGFLVYMTMANVGLAVVFVLVPWLFVVFKAVGAVYLAYLAWQALKPGGRGPFETHSPTVRRPGTGSHDRPGIPAWWCADHGQHGRECHHRHRRRLDRLAHRPPALLGHVAAQDHWHSAWLGCSHAGPRGARSRTHLSTGETLV